MLHTRAIVLDARGQADAGAEVTLRIEDERGERVHTAKRTASKFGVVSDSWVLPASASLGQYLIAVSEDDEELGRHVVRVGRYELPLFRVTAALDRRAYLPGEAVKVRVSGAYLFGKPVPKGRVKITRRDSEELATTGVAGGDGEFEAQLNLDEDWAALRAEQRFRDVALVASYEDPVSGRSEQRRFDVRLSREAIHVYVRRGYVMTAYADGRPAAATVELRAGGRVAKASTNRYGVGRVAWEAEGEVEVRATDAAGLSGRHAEYVSAGVRSPLRWELGRTLHRAGEAVTVGLMSSAAEQAVVVHAIAEGRRVASRVVLLKNHRGEVTFPYQAEFRRTVVFAVAGHAAMRAVVFPDGSDLTLKVSPERGTYRPGESAGLRIAVASLDAKPVAAAVGLAVVDAAVLERARTDTEFGRRSWFACAFCVDVNESEIGGIRLNDLYTLPASTVISPELDLVAEVLAAEATAEVRTDTDESLARPPQFSLISAQMERHYLDTLEFPETAEELDRMAYGALAADPWGSPWLKEFGWSETDRFVTIRSAGPDKLAGTADDFETANFRRPYFAPLRRLIAEALAGEVDYPADLEAFAKLLGARGLLWESLRDPWGTPYRVAVRTYGAARNIEIGSDGPDRVAKTRDDIVVATFRGTYFRREAQAISEALRVAEPKPQNLAEFEALLDRAGLGQLRDPWQRPIRVTSAVSSSYGDRVSVETRQVFGGTPQRSMVSTPVTQKFVTFTLHSDGPDGLPGTYDDFTPLAFPVLLSEERAAVARAEGSPVPAPAVAGTGKIAGVVVDSAGARVAQAAVTLLDAQGGAYRGTANGEGVFYFAAVPPGLYEVRAEAPGFQRHVLSQVPVFDGKTTNVTLELQVGAVTQSVSVRAAVPMIETQASSVSGEPVPVGTPRVRDYFPETLLWLPELLTDAGGLARTELKLADSVTTWKIAAVASTLDGRIVESEGEVRAFQPFFLEFSPPLVLTDGDQMSLPMTVRNYGARAESVGLSLQLGAGLVGVGAATASVPVPANGSANAAFVVQARGTLERVAARVVAKGARAQDAIEKSIRVHPDGQEVSRTYGDLVEGATAFPVSIPAAAIAGATRAELRVYPNLGSLLLESAEALLVTPHGCAEQTISAAYANLIAWRFAQAAGVRNALVEKRALGHVRLGVEQLEGFRTPGGGLGYWHRGDADIAVTAQALSFLVEAAALIPVETEKITTLIGWLAQHLPEEDHLALLVARALAAAKRAGHAVPPGALGAVYHRLASVTDLREEPYQLANFILAALDSGDDKLLGDAALRLARQARAERGGAYWDLARNTPFHGWGNTGRYETTGLVVSALAAWRAAHPAGGPVASELEGPIRQGLYFLLRGRDQQGTWYSTQATLRAIQALTAASLTLGPSSRGTVEVLVNDRLVRSLRLPVDPQSTDPVLVDLPLPAGESVLGLRALGGKLNVLTRLTVTHWVPWTVPATSAELRYSVVFDGQEVGVGDLVRCTVKAERVGFRGYGMLLAEVGLPPGAEVDRTSLAAAGADYYEVEPDRVVFYLWPRAGGTSFSFLFRPRFAMTAQSAPSRLYDYNNPEARAEMVPSRWVVR
jgi:hypothetical protein